MKLTDYYKEVVTGPQSIGPDYSGKVYPYHKIVIDSQDHPDKVKAKLEEAFKALGESGDVLVLRQSPECKMQRPGHHYGYARAVAVPASVFYAKLAPEVERLEKDRPEPAKNAALIRSIENLTTAVHILVDRLDAQTAGTPLEVE